MELQINSYTCVLKAIHYTFLFPTIYLHHRPHILRGEDCVTLERVEMISEAFLKV